MQERVRSTLRSEFLYVPIVFRAYSKRTCTCQITLGLVFLGESVNRSEACVACRNDYSSVIEKLGGTSDDIDLLRLLLNYFAVVIQERPATAEKTVEDFRKEIRKGEDDPLDILETRIIHHSTLNSALALMTGGFGSNGWGFVRPVSSSLR